jgi:hypothetical protein
MDDSKSDLLTNKYSTPEVIGKATRILAVVSTHIDNDNCEHCQKLLEKAGLRTQPEHSAARTTFTTQTGNVDLEVHSK